MEQTSSYAPGDVAETTYGVGVITHCPVAASTNEESPTGTFYRVMLWRVPGKSIGSSSVAHLQPNAIGGKLPAAPGMVTTKVEDPSQQRYMVQCYDSFQKTYRITPLVVPTLNAKSKSITNDAYSTEDGDEKDASSTAIHNPQLLSRTSLTGQMMISQQTQSNHDSNKKNNHGEAAMVVGGAVVSEAGAEIVPATALAAAPSAKFYPLICELMKRGDQTAAVTTGFFQSDKVTKVLGKAQTSQAKLMEEANKALEQHGSKLSSAAEQAMATAGDDQAIATQVKKVVNEEEIQQLFSMIKNEDLTVLLEKGKQRLEQLVQTDIPKATEQALLQTGIRVANDNDTLTLTSKTVNGVTETGAVTSVSSYSQTILQSRQLALKSMQKLLDQAEVDPKDLEAIRDSLGENFHTMFDSLTQAAKSDRYLASLLETMTEQTAEWQEATGRLMATKSASLFLEGASRIQARAANLFSKDQLNWAGEIGSKFTKAFTEGDAAVARIKSIELGEKVRDRLVNAIEVRSESLGGLDGIIAGALTTMKGSGETGDQMKNMLTTLQSRATSVTKDANETLISVLARRSEYRDIALLKVEQVMCDLESQFGDDLSPEDIAAVARGEGGTAKLFEPIAKRAAKEIEKQLDAAEESVTDQTMIDVLKHVRKIVSGELTLQAVLDDVVNILNDDSVVAAGENLMKQSEQVLDAIEGVSGNKVVDDVMQIAQKAGFTKDKIMQGVEKLDVNELLDNAGSAISDEKARAKLLSDATDTALDFILRVLPSMPIPPFDGVKDGLVYNISNLSMEGFKVKKENILVEIAGMRATKRAKTLQITEIRSDSGSQSDSFEDALPHPYERTESTTSMESTTMDLNTSVDENVVVKATELLIIDVREISAVFNDAMWGFEQTYLPYLKGEGKFDVKMSDGSIRLVFELRRRLKDGAQPKYGKFDPSDWVPVLALHNRSCAIGSVEFAMQGGSRLAWVVNKAASMFKGLLRDYVVRTILRILSDKSGWILSKLNEGLSPFWDVLLRTAKLQMEDLEEAGLEDIVAAKPVEKSNLLELVWRERLPLGMNLLLNDESGQLKVVDFPRGSQARTVCEGRNLDPEGFKGATIVAVNGIRYQTDDDLFEALRDPGRPKTIQFELADTEDAERIRKFVEEGDGSLKPKPSPRSAGKRAFATRKVTFVDPIDLGVEFANSEDNHGLVVRKFLEGEGGIVLAAERNEKIGIGDLLTHVNGKLVLGADGSGRVKALKALEAEGNQRPLTLTFSDPYLYRSIFEQSPGLPTSIGGPTEFEMEVQQIDGVDSKRVVLTGFKDVDGVSEKSGVLLGDYLVFINGVAVGAGCRWMGEPNGVSLDEVLGMLKSKTNYPIGLTFARPLKHRNESRGWFGGGGNKEEQIAMDNSETICVSAEAYEQLGLILDMKDYSDIVVKDLEAVPGPFQTLTNTFADKETGTMHLSIESVNGEFVPSFANPQLVRSAMERGWKSDTRVEVVFCDDERKVWIQGLNDE